MFQGGFNCVRWAKAGAQYMTQESTSSEESRIGEERARNIVEPSHSTLHCVPTKTKKPGRRIRPGCRTLGELFRLSEFSELYAGQLPGPTQAVELRSTCRYAPPASEEQPQPPAFAPASRDFRLRGQTSTDPGSCPNRCRRGRRDELARSRANSPGDRQRGVRWSASDDVRRNAGRCLPATRTLCRHW